VCVIIGVSMTAFLLLRLVGGAKFERIGLKLKMKGASRDYNQTPQMLVVLGAVNGSLVINPHFSGPTVRIPQAANGTLIQVFHVFILVPMTWLHNAKLSLVFARCCIS
jgi:hypothetical protein